MNGPYEDAGHEESGHPERPDRITAALGGRRRPAPGRRPRSWPRVRAPPAPSSRGSTRAPTSTSWEPSATPVAATSTRTPTPPTTRGRSPSTPPARARASSSELRRHDEGVGFIATRPPGHHASARPGHGLLPAQQRRGRRGLARWSRASASSSSIGTCTTATAPRRSSGTSPTSCTSRRTSGRSSRAAVPPTRSAAWARWARRSTCPLPPGATGDVIRRALEEVAAPAIDEFDPTWVLVSAGFDSHRDDPMADLAAHERRLRAARPTRRGLRTASRAPRACSSRAATTSRAARPRSPRRSRAVLSHPYEPEAPQFRAGPGTEMVRERPGRTARGAAHRAGERQRKEDYPHEDA